MCKEKKNSQKEEWEFEVEDVQVAMSDVSF
jgi:hypothetical protein